MNRCDWCQEIGELVAIVNRDKTSSRLVEYVCADCAEVEQFEHAHEIGWGNPIGFMPVRSRKVIMTTSLDERLAS